MASLDQGTENWDCTQEALNRVDHRTNFGEKVFSPGGNFVYSDQRLVLLTADMHDASQG